MNGRFIAVGMKVVNGQRTGAIFTSSDGLIWNEQSSGVRESLFGAAYGNGTYLIGGFMGTILTSGNAVNWVQKNSDSGAVLTGLAYGNGTFIAVGCRYGGVDGVSRHPAMFSSSDLVTWTQIASPADEPLSDIVYTGSDSTPGSFVAVGGWGSVLVSNDGSSWQKHSAQRTMSAIAVHDGTLVAVGGGGTILRSTNMVNWSLRGAGTQGYLMDVAYGSGSFVAVGDGGTILMSQDDGQSWTAAELGCNGESARRGIRRRPVRRRRRFGEVLTSTDGHTWTLQSESLGMNGGYEVYYSAQIPGFMALGLDGRMATSPDGASWTAHIAAPATACLRASSATARSSWSAAAARSCSRKSSRPCACSVRSRALRALRDPEAKSPGTARRADDRTCATPSRLRRRASCICPDRGARGCDSRRSPISSTRRIRPGPMS